MAELLNLPPEILIDVCQSADEESRLALCLVSRHLNQLCTPVLYSNILLISSISTVNFCRTVTRSKLAADSVRSLCFAFAPNSIRLDAYYAAMRSATAALKSLVSLKLNDPTSYGLVYVLRDANLPHLEELNVMYTQTAEQHAALYHFLARHPTIRDLIIHVPTSAPVNIPFAEPAMLPRLRTYIGADEWMGVVLPHAHQLREVNFEWWERPRDNLFRTAETARLTHLLSQSKGSLHTLVASCFNWDPRSLLVVRELTNLKCLTLGSSCTQEIFERPEFIDAIEREILPNLTHLRLLRLFQSGYRDGSTTPSRWDELGLVCRWHQLRPSLDTIKFAASCGWRKAEMGGSDGMAVWFPVTMQGGNELQWTIAVMVSKKYPGDTGDSQLQPLVNCVRAEYPHLVDEEDIDLIQQELERAGLVQLQFL